MFQGFLEPRAPQIVATAKLYRFQALPLLLPRPLLPLPLLRLILLLPPTPVSLPQTPHAPLQALCIPCKEPIQLIRLHHRGQLDLFTLQPMLF